MAVSAARPFKLDVLITAIDRITAPMQRIQARIQRMTAPFVPVQNSLAALWQASGATRLVEGFKGVWQELDHVGESALKTGKRILGVGAAAGAAAFGFKRLFIDPTDEMQRLGLSLIAIEKGNRDLARTDIGFIKRLSLTSPFGLTEMTDVFRTMRAQGLDPLNGQMQSLVDYIAKIGGSNDVLERMALELGHASSMGKLQSQQARALAREGIPVWDLLGRAIERVTKGRVKLNEAQLIDRSEKGGIGRKDIGLLIEQMGLESRGMAALMATKTFSGMMNVLFNQAKFFAQRVMKIDDLGQAIQGGPMDILQGKLRGITAWIDRVSKNGDLQRWADQLGTQLMRLFNWLLYVFPIAWNFLTVTLPNKLQTLIGKVQWIGDLFGWDNVATFGLAAYIAGPLVSSVFSLIGAIAQLNVALFGTPAGLLLLGGELVLAGGVIAWKSLKGGPFQGAQTPAGGRIGASPLFGAQSAVGTPENPFGSGLFMRMPTSPEDLYGGPESGGTAAPSSSLVPPRPQAPLGFSDDQVDRIVSALDKANGKARVDINVNAPAGTRASIAPGSNASLRLGMRMNRGPAMAEAY